jgi:hypothetical protein
MKLQVDLQIPPWGQPLHEPPAYLAVLGPDAPAVGDPGDVGIHGEGRLAQIDQHHVGRLLADARQRREEPPSLLHVHLRQSGQIDAGERPRELHQLPGLVLFIPAGLINSASLSSPSESRACGVILPTALLRLWYARNAFLSEVFWVNMTATSSSKTSTPARRNTGATNSSSLSSTNSATLSTMSRPGTWAERQSGNNLCFGLWRF